MKSELPRAILQAAQLAVAVFATVFLEPRATAHFPQVPQWAVLAALAVISSVLVEIATLAIVGRPLVELVWFEEQDPNPLTEVRPHMPTSLVYTVHANLSGGSWLTRLAVWRLARSDASIRVRLPASPAMIVVDRAPRETSSNRMLATPNDGRGFDLQLRSPTRPSTLWMWADLRFETADSAISGVPIDAIYECSGSGLMTQISAKVVKVRSNVKVVRFRSV